MIPIWIPRKVAGLPALPSLTTVDQHPGVGGRVSSCGPCATRVVAGLTAWGSLPAMLTANRALALTLFVAACGPDINITSGATGDAGLTTTDPGTTGLGVSESGPVEPGTTFGDTSETGTDSSGEDSITGSTGGDSSGGESPPVCAVFDDRCKCDGVPANPWLCGCAMADDGCICADGLVHPDYSCGWECNPSGADLCVCGNYPAPAEWCCDIIPPQPCPV